MSELVYMFLWDIENRRLMSFSCYFNSGSNLSNLSFLKMGESNNKFFTFSAKSVDCQREPFPFLPFLISKYSCWHCSFVRYTRSWRTVSHPENCWFHCVYPISRPGVCREASEASRLCKCSISAGPIRASSPCGTEIQALCLQIISIAQTVSFS